LELSSSQRRFFDSFGFLRLPGLMVAELGWITEEFEAALADSGQLHDGGQRTSFTAAVEGRERLCALLEHPRIHGVLRGLLGDDFLLLGMGADIYAGDSQWHPDMAVAPVRHVKLAMYLDPLTAATGALRLVPGSHLQGYEGNQDTQALWGIAPQDVPCYCPDNTPGDVVVFDLRTLHNAIGGGRRRRMLNLVCCAPCDTTEALAYLDSRLAAASGPLYSDVMVDTASPERSRHLAQVLTREQALGKSRPSSVA
jgi:hypothetical protein